MNTMAFIWLVLFAVAALLFFCIAAVISVLGFRDLLDLLAGASKKTPYGGSR
jgi:hypothetical protein